MRPAVMKRLPGNKGGRVFDFRGTGLLEPNGGRIPVLVMTEHIPVMRDKPGIADFLDLARVIKAQDLGLQGATDGEGNAAIFTDFNRLCFQARGANAAGPGIEHMHMTIHQPWEREQLNASAFLWHYAHVVHGLPKRRGKLAPGGPGLARVVRKGHVRHKDVADAAGFRDRSDPGPGYDFEYVQHAANWFARKRTFTGV